MGHVATPLEDGAKLEVAHQWAGWLHNPYHMGGPSASQRGAESELAHKWAGWIHRSCRPGGPHRFKARGTITPAA